MVKCPSEKATEILEFSAFTQRKFDPYRLVVNFDLVLIAS